MTYQGDPRHYKRYKIEGRYYVQCLETRITNGEKFVCNFENKREDKVKVAIKAGKLHQCVFIKEQEKHNSLLTFYSDRKISSETFDYTEERLKSQFVYLIGRRRKTFQSMLQQVKNFITLFYIALSTGFL